MELVGDFAKLTEMETPELPQTSAEGTAAPQLDFKFAPDPNDPPWNSFAATGVWIISVFLIFLFPTMFLLPYLATLNPPIKETAAIVEFAQTDKTAVLLQIVSIIPAHIFTLVIAWFVITRGGRFKFWKTLGNENGGIKWWHYTAILVGFFAIAYAVGMVVPEQDNDLLRILQSSRAAVFVVAFMATFTAPIVEEVIYRGVLYSAFQRKAGALAAFVIVTFLFAIVHVPQYYPSYSTIFLLTLLSIILTSMRVISGNILPCIVLHTLFNGLQSILIIIDHTQDKADTQQSVSFVISLFK